MDTQGHAEEQGMGFQELMRHQNAVYAYLGKLFYTEVDEEQLEQLRAMKLPARTGNEHLDSGYRELVGFLNTSWERTRSDLAVDFVRTFVGLSQEIEQTAHPYESVYTSPEHLMMQDSRDEVLAAYRSEKVILDGATEPEDHLYFELCFVQLLGQRALDALEAGDEDECVRLLEKRRDFTDEHLLNWVYNFAADVHRLASTGFYKGAADILLGAIELDREFLDEALSGEEA